MGSKPLSADSLNYLIPTPTPKINLGKRCSRLLFAVDGLRGLRNTRGCRALPGENRRESGVLTFLNQSDLYAVGYGLVISGKVALAALRPGLGDYTASACSVELIGHRVSSPSAIGSSRHRRLSGGLCGEVIISFHLRFCPQQPEALGVQRRVSKKRVGSSFHRR